jgi:hypothetical protein
MGRKTAGQASSIPEAVRAVHPKSSKETRPSDTAVQVKRANLLLETRLLKNATFLRNRRETRSELIETGGNRLARVARGGGSARKDRSEGER